MQTTVTTGRRGKYQPSVVAQLRALMPRRPLSFSEGVRIAALQATRFLDLTGWTDDAPVPESLITELPRIDVRPSYQLTGSGVTMWHQGAWRIRVNALEPFTRQRFSIAHEFKHVLDAAHEDVIYGYLPVGSKQRHAHIEGVCDAFAAALLMPKVLVRQLWFSGTQDPAVLAWRFLVSQRAMRIRLENLGLVECQPRSAGRLHDNTTAVYHLGRTAVRGSGTYRRGRHYHRRKMTLRFAITDDHCTQVAGTCREEVSV